MPRPSSEVPPTRCPAWQGFWHRLALIALLGLAGGCASVPPNTHRTASNALHAPEQTPLGRLADTRRAADSARSDSGFRLLDGVEIALTSRLALIVGAQRTLDLQYYAIHADASTEVILQRLRAAARRGVRVRILLDDFNSVGADAQVLRLAFEPGIEVRLFNPLPGSRSSMMGRLLGSLHDIPRIQKRMHNKVFVADNAWGIIGGRNLGDRYFGTGETQNFVDLDVLAAGRIVRDMSASFDRFWNDDLAYPVQALLSQRDLEQLRSRELPAQDGTHGGGAAALAPAQAPGAVLPDVTAAEALEAERAPLDLHTVPLRWAPSTLLVDQPGKVAPDDDEVETGDTVIDGLVAAMQLAQRDILIVSPYFVPGAQVMGVYGQLRQRGVRIRVLTNSLASNDAPAAHAGYERYRLDLLAMGVELYEMRAEPQAAHGLTGSGGDGSGKGKGAFGLASGAGSTGNPPGMRASLHAKAVLIDTRLSIIGSMNLDLRSQLQNSEVALVIRGAPLAQELTRQIEATLAKAAYRVEQRQGRLHWSAPAGVDFGDESEEPGAGATLRLIVWMVAPFAPDAML